MMAVTVGQVAQVALMGHELDRAEPELRAFIEAMSEDAQAELVAIMWIGRGSFLPEEVAEAIETARSEASTPCADYLIGTPHMSDHLENGLDALGISALDVEDTIM